MADTEGNPTDTEQANDSSTKQQVEEARKKVEQYILDCKDASTSESLLAACKDKILLSGTDQTLKKTGKPLDYCSKERNLSPLEMAVSDQLVDAVRVILENDLGSVDEIFGFNCTCLCKCCYSFDQNVELIKVLLYYGAEPNATISNDTSSANCLITAIVKGNLEVVKLLLDYGADIYYQWKGQNALGLAMDFRKFEIVETIEQYEFKRAKRNRGFKSNRAGTQPTDANSSSSDDNSVGRPTGGNNNNNNNNDSTGLTSSISVAAPLASGVKRPDAPSSFYDDFNSLDWVLDFDRELKLCEKLGEGGFGEVFKGKVGKSEDRVAVKLCHCQDAKVHGAFKQEVKLLSTFRHENIVLFRGACLQPPKLCIVSELMECNLYDYLHEPCNQDASIPWHLKLKWVRDLARGMNYLHSLEPPVVHRDLKSLNVLLDEYQRVKLCDFGMARVKEQTFIVTGHIGGSPAWMAPECLRGDDFNEKSDVFAFGVILWEILTQQIPWPGKQMAQLVGMVGFQNKYLELPELSPKTMAPAAFKGYIDMINDSWEPTASERPTFKSLVERSEDLIAKHAEWTKRP